MSIDREIRALIAKDSAARFAFRHNCSQTPNYLDIRLQDVHPQISAVLNLRVAAWVRKLVESGLDELMSEVARTLERAGY